MIGLIFQMLISISSYFAVDFLPDELNVVDADGHK